MTRFDSYVNLGALSLLFLPYSPLSRKPWKTRSNLATANAQRNLEEDNIDQFTRRYLLFNLFHQINIL